ncbi:c-type cytochrome, partial [Devosia sp.]|uniref:c-type cytochrome n=1 Tax=Devosia sp. TaxID=1871048 RepID=UPI002FCA573E
MNRTRRIGLSGGAAVMVAVGSALIAVSGTAPGLANPALQAIRVLPAPPSENPLLLAQAEVAPVQAPVSYAADQADRGKQDYEDNCTECHGEDLNGGLLGGAPLKGLSFEEKYAKGAPAGMLFEIMSATMPPN